MTTNILVFYVILSRVHLSNISFFICISKSEQRDYYMTFSISALVLTWDTHIKPNSEAGGLIWVEGWYQGPYGKFHVIILLSHILHWPFPSIDFYFAKKIYEQTNCENKSLRELVAFVQLANIFVSNLVSKIYQTMSICTMTLETVCKIYPRRWHLNGNSYSTRRIYLN
jgi:hypothetical protein